MDLTYRKIKATDLDQVDDILVHQFFVREPLGVQFELTDPSYFQPWIRNLTQPRTEVESVSIGCFHGEKLAGLALNVVEYKDSSKNAITLDTIMKEYAPTYSKINVIFGDLHKKVDVFGDMEALLHLEISVVDANYARHGISNKLMELSCKEGAKMGLKGAFAETTGKYSGMVVEKFHCKKLIALKYKDCEVTKNFDTSEHDELAIWRVLF